MQNKKIPLRMCTGCGEMKSKYDLIRVVKSKEGEIFVDLTGKANGRGAYICNNKNCFKKAIKAKRFEKAFSQQISEDIYKKLESYLND